MNLGQEMPELAVALDHDKLASFSRVMSIHKSSFDKVNSRLLDPHCMHTGDYRTDRQEALLFDELSNSVIWEDKEFSQKLLQRIQQIRQSEMSLAPFLQQEHAVWPQLTPMRP